MLTLPAAPSEVWPLGGGGGGGEDGGGGERREEEEEEDLDMYISILFTIVGILRVTAFRCAFCGLLHQSFRLCKGKKLKKTATTKAARRLK